MAIAIMTIFGVAIFIIQMALVAYIIAHELHECIHFPKYSLLHHHEHQQQG